MPAARRRAGRDAAGANAHVDPMSYPDKTDMGPTVAHMALGRDRHSFMFEQVRSVWVARNWCWIFAATVGMLLPPAIEPHLVPWLAAQNLPPLLVGGLMGVLGSFFAAWLALEALRRADDVLGNFTQEELEDRRAAWTVSLIGWTIQHAVLETQAQPGRLQW